MPVQPITAQELASILKLPEGTTVTLTGPAEGLALSTSYLANFDGSAGTPFFILSTGHALDVTAANTGEDQGFDYDPADEDGDTLTVTFTIPKPVWVTGVTFDFTFLSEEYPEYVGDAFNDFFSVKVNGVEAAIDLNGKIVTVNNNFFTNQYRPTGTFFDGQTPPLTVSAPVNINNSTLEIKLTVSDVGDGIYDSAAFIKGLKLTEPQYVYVDFNYGHVDFNSFAGLPAGFDLPGATLTTSQREDIMEWLDEEFKDFMIVFSTTRPTSGREYSTIHVGGKIKDLPDWMSVPENGKLTGRAEQTDYGNQDKSDNAFILAGELEDDMFLIRQAIAHETGHLVGLRHVLDDTELMYPFTTYTSELIDGEELLAEVDEAGNVVEVGGTQDTRAELIRNLGPVTQNTLTVRESSFDSIVKYFRVSANSLLPRSMA